jgi:hypothetical protein
MSRSTSKMFLCPSTTCTKVYSSADHLARHIRSYPNHHRGSESKSFNSLFDVQHFGTFSCVNYQDKIKLLGCPFWKSSNGLLFPAKRAILLYLGKSLRNNMFRSKSQVRLYFDSVFAGNIEKMMNTIVQSSSGEMKQSHKVVTATIKQIVKHGRIIKAMYVRPKSSKSRLRAASIMQIGVSAMAGDLDVCKMVSDKSDQLSGTTSILTRTSFPANQVPSANNISQIHRSIAAQQALDTSNNSDQLEDKNSLASSVEFINGSYTITSKWLRRIVLEMDAAAEPQEESHNSGLVYFIRLGETSLVKVGMTGNIDQRIRTLQCGSPFELNIEYTIQTGQPRLMESMMHRTLTKMGLHVRGEWFSLIAGFVHIDLYLQTKMLMKYKN